MKAQDLKKSILQYAMQGKLVPQDPNDEPASLLLERIKAEKEQLIKEGKIKKEKPLPPITKDEIPYILPQGWEWARLGDVGTSNIGLTYKPDHICTKNGTPVLRSSNIQNGKINLLDLVRVTTRINNDNLIVQDGDILICARNGSKALVGKSAIIENLPEKMSFGAFMAIYRTSINKYVNLYLDSPLFKATLSAVNTVTINQITQGNLKNAIIPIPPIEEQKRIVEKIEQILPLVEEYAKNEDKLTIINEKLPSNLRQAILQYAVQGKLLPQNPNDEPASILLKGIKAKKEQMIKKGKIKKEKSLPAISEGQIPYALPKEWRWVRTIDISQTNPRNDLEDNKQAGFVPMNLISAKYGESHRFEVKLWKEIKSGFTHFKNDDIVVAKITPCFQNGKSTVIKDLPNGFGAGTTELHVIRTISILPKFLLIHFKSPDFLNNGKQLMTGCAGQQRISRQYMENYILGLPPIEEQKRIVEKVDELMKLCDELEEQIKNPKLAVKILEKITKKLPEVKKSNVIDITEVINQRAIFRAYVISQFKNDKHFGAIKCEKLTYLPEKIIELPLGGDYEKQIAGPLDNDAKKKVEEIFKQLKWVNVIDGNTSQSTKYIPDVNFSKHEELFDLCFGDKKSEIDNLLNLFKSKSSTECEAVATLYAVWNDLLIDNKPASQEDIISGFYKWSAKKTNFNRNDLYETLTWMKMHNIIPTGKGNKTILKPQQTVLF